MGWCSTTKLTSVRARGQPGFPEISVTKNTQKGGVGNGDPAGPLDLANSPRAI